MNRRTRILVVIGLLAVAGAWLFWWHGSPKAAVHEVATKAQAGQTGQKPVAAAATNAMVAAASKFPTLNTNKLAFLLSNTTDSFKKLLANPHAILLENASIDTDKRLDLKIPSHLRSSGNPGEYIVQARGVMDARFRLTLQSAGAEFVSFIPNNAYLVNLSAAGAAQLAGNPLVQAVLPWEPYYKIQYSLLGLAVNQQPLPPGTALNLGVFAADAATADQEIEKLGAVIIGHDHSAFGPVVRVLAPEDWTTLAQSPILQFIEPAHTRRMANDLSRVTAGITPDTTSGITNNWMNLTGSNVLVAVNDTGIDVNHPDFSASGTAATGPSGPTRVTGLNPIDLVDVDGHGTHVAGSIAGNGSESLGASGPLGPGPNVGAFAEGSVSNADFRGRAPLASLFSMGLYNSDYSLQTNAAMINALISNNSWDYGNGDLEYDLAAASYDAATRDALPYATGSQPVLFVFAAGNDGDGQDDGTQGAADTIVSPGTAKNVITVGGLEQFRFITNLVSTIVPGVGTNAPTTNQVAYWEPETDSANQVAFYSSRGNVGVGTEGIAGRFKPDVVSPGSFVVSTRSSQWNTNTYYNPTNDLVASYPNQIVSTNGLVYYTVAVPPTAVAVNITIFPNILSPNPFPGNLLIYARQATFPTTTNYDILTSMDGLDIPPASGGAISGIQTLLGNGFSFAVGNSNSFPVNYDMTVEVFTTNNVGNLYQVLQGMNETIAPYYRYESGTSMAAAGVSGVLALIQDYFTNTLALTPSPALMKALLINGSRSVGSYKLAVTNGINFQGWGLNNIQNSLPLGGLTNQFNSPISSFFVDQNPTNALATGDSHTFIVTLDPTTYSQYLPLQATLVWTDPPGDPAAALKLVNNLDLIITNLDTTDANYGAVYVGNDISPDVGFNQPWNTNGPPNLDSVNNVENILLQPILGMKYSVTVVGRSVNVNAVTAQTNNAAGQYEPNVVQDFALVVSVGDSTIGQVTNGFSVTDGGIASNPTGDQDITIVTSTNTPLFDQIAGASSPLLGTNTVPLGTNTIWGPNGLVTIGQTNQWHFYVITNTGPATDFTNAAFITYGASTLSIPRMGVLDPLGLPDATRPEGDIDMYVSQDASLTNLSPVAISNALAGTSLGGVGDGGTALAQGGTEYVFFTNSAPGQVYYVGVKSEDREAVEYSFLPLFTDVPFSGLDQNGDEIVNGLLLPMPTLGGNNAHPGVTNIFALATIPMEVEKITVTNLDEHQNFGDLFGELSFGGQHVVLNNHDGFGNTFGHLPIVYDDSVDHVAGTTNSDGPGSLVNFRGLSALGPWILSELDDSAGGLTGQVSRLTLLIQPHRDLNEPGFVVAIPPGGWFVDYVDVPVGFTNLTFYGTNVTAAQAGSLPPGTPPLQMYERLGNDPTLVSYDQEATLTNGTPPGNSISTGPPLAQGRYFVGVYNPSASTVSQYVFLSATLGVSQSVSDIYNYMATSGQSIPDDAVTPVPAPNSGVPGSTIAVLATNQIASVSVGIVMDTPRISDYTFTLVSPTGQRVLLMENRGGGDTNGAGLEFVYTNILNSTATGGAGANTNYLAVDPNATSFPITWNFYTVPDQMTVYDTTNPALFSLTGAYLLYNSGLTNNPPAGGGGTADTIPVTVNVSYPLGTSNVTIIMNQFGSANAANGDAWIYTAGSAMTNYEYLEFTDNTNLANVPIKFAPPPFSFEDLSTNFALSDFDLATNGDYRGPTNIYDAFGGWNVPTNLVVISTVLNLTNGLPMAVTNLISLTNNFVSVVTDPSSALAGDTGGSNYLALADGTITRLIPTIPGRTYNVTFWYRGPGIAAWWRGEGNALDSSDPENDNNNGTLIGRFNFPAGEVDQAFEFGDPGNTYQFAGTNTYVQVPASPSLNVGAGGGFTVEGWISPTNLSRPAPLVEWLARVPTNSTDTNLAVVQGPVLDPATGHYYYLLAATNWQTSEIWATNLGGHLVTVETANEENWIYDTFTAYGTLNRDLWIGLGFTNGNYGWTSGFTSLAYTNWAPGQPSTCGPNQYYVAVMGPTNAYPGLWELEDNNGLTCGNSPTNPIYGVVEVNEIQTNGVQFWISGTNGTPDGPNALAGCLYANIVDTSFVSHQIFSAPGLLASNVFQHVALTYNTNSGIAALYLNGTNVASTNLGAFMPKTDGDLLLGWDMSLYTNNYYNGLMDEMSVYGRPLSDAEISAIYNVSAESTNRLIGKFDPSITPAVGLAEAIVTFGSVSNVIYGVNNQWKVNSYTFTATSNSLPLTISGKEPGILLDAFAVEEAPETNLYYLPEQTLSALNGASAFGDWTLQIWDNRAGAYVPNANQLVNWDLSFVLASNAVVSASLPPEQPVTTTPPAGQTVYYAVTVPAWAHEATNLLVSSDYPVNLLYFSPVNPPTGAGNTPDATLLANQTSGVGLPVLATTAGAPFTLVPGSTYYLGVQNLGPRTATVTLEVDFDILGLTNGVPFSDVLTNEYGLIRYFSYLVNSNATEATFQLLKLTGNADLVVSKGVPLPDLSTADYGSFNNSTADQDIYVLTNSAPVPLSAGLWFLGVLNRDGTPIQYSVLAKELDTNSPPVMPVVIPLTNGVPFTWTAGPGAALTNFFWFHATNSVIGGTNVNLQSLRFELYSLIGNGDLTLQTNGLPLAPPFFQTSQNSGQTPELIYVFTNSMVTNLATDWYLGVPNREITNITYSIVVETQTKSYFPAFPGAEGAGGGAVGAGHAGAISSVYHVTTDADSGPGSLRTAVSAPNRTVVFDIAGIIGLESPLVITSSNLTIAGQTSPGGITVAGNMTTVTSTHDVIVRDIRFRRGAADDSFQFYTASNVIADHISAEWTSDNLISVLNSSNVTVQWSIMADSLYSTNSSPTNGPTGSLLRQGGGQLSFNHNLYADNYTGSPRLGDNLTLDFVNNVIYNWGFRSGLSDGTSDLLDFSPNGYTNQLNYVCNYLIAGPDTANFSTNNYNITNIAFFGGETSAMAATWIFQTNNFIDSDNNGVLNGADTGLGMFTNTYTLFSRPFPTPLAPVDEAYQAYEKVMDFAGVDLSQRDPVDTNIVTNVRYQTGRLISSVPLLVPGIVAWWKGESNYLDSAGGNNASTPNGAVGFAPGKVGTAFSINSGQYLVANPAAPSSLDIGQGSGITIEEWINPTSVTAQQLLCEYEPVLGGNTGGGINFAIQNNAAGVLYANLADTANNGHEMYSPAGVLVPNVWQHVAVTYDKASGTGSLYVNGVAVTVTNLGNFTPQTSFTNFLMGASTYNGGINVPNTLYTGLMDEVTLYSYALSSNKIAAIYNADSRGKFAVPAATGQAYLDTDQDGLPDWWENTFTTNLVYVQSNNRDRDGDGYTDLEEYNNWLAAPHALTSVTNPVAVDLYQMCGESGHLEFFLTNSIQGFVYLTNVIGSVTNTTPWSNSIAVFTPTNNASGTNYDGYASFSFYVTNMDTSAYFGPVPVSVIVSAVPILTNRPIAVITLTNGLPLDPCNPYGSDYYQIDVPTNATVATFELDNPSGPMVLAVGYGYEPSLSQYDYITNFPPSPGNLVITVTTNSSPVPLAGGLWYMTAVNVNPAGEDCYTARITYAAAPVPPEFIFPTNGMATNIFESVPWSLTCQAMDLDSPPLALTFGLVNGPPGMSLSGDVLSWTPTVAEAPSTNTVQVSVSNGAFIVTNSFEIIVEESNQPPVLPIIPNQFVIVGNTLVVNNTAVDPNPPGTTLGYVLTSTVTPPDQPVIDLNGIITWTPTLGQIETNYLFTTVVTDTNPWAVNAQSLSDTNTFGVFVVPSLTPGLPGAPITNTFSVGASNIFWFAVPVPTNAIYATNTLLSSTASVNIWFSTNLPPTITNANDRSLIWNATNGVSVLSTNLVTAPTNIVQGGTYFLGVQNTNNVPATGTIEIEFAFAPPAVLSLPFIPDQYIAAGDTLVVADTAMDENPGATLAYSLANAPVGAVINPASGLVTWATTTNMAVPATVLFTAVVTDTGANLSATNSFHVTVLPGLTDDQPQTNIIAPNGINWFLVHVPVNADMATNFLLFATAPVNFWYSTNESITSPSDVEFLISSTGGSRVITTTSTPALVPGSRYFLGVQNTNSFAVTNAVKVKFHLVSPVIYSITQTNIAGTNGFQVAWFAPSGFQFHLQWTPALAPATWTNFNGVISFTSFIAATNSEFQYFDDGSQTGGFGPNRFYRLLLLNSPTNTAPFFLNTPTLLYASPSNSFAFTNTAKDWDIPAQILTYSIKNSLGDTNVTINPNTGLITWTPNISQLGLTNTITTTVTDNGVPAKSAVNAFGVVVTTNTMFVLAFNSVAIVTNGVQFEWTAPTNEQFQVQWTTNLAPAVWHLFPNIINSTNGNFYFVDTNMPLLWMKFYDLILLP